LISGVFSVTVCPDGTSTLMKAAADNPAPTWLAGLREGDADAREAFAAYALPRVVAWCRRVAGRGVDAEDAAHEVMLVALDKAHALGDDPRIEAWLFAICRRVLANHRRRVWWNRWRPVATGVEGMPGGSADPERAVASRRRADLAHACLEALPVRHREVLVLYDLEERNAKEVAEILDLTPEAVRALVMRARRNMKKAAKKAGYRPGEGDPR